MRALRAATAALLAAYAAHAGAAEATTVVVFVEPMTFQKYTRVFDTPGPDRFLMCMAPPSTSGCSELPFRKRR
jgi:hypothetical protein